MCNRGSLSAFLVQDWSLKSLFGRGIEQSCPVSSASQIRVSIPEDQPHLLTPEAGRVDGSYAVFDVSGGEIVLVSPFSAFMNKYFAVTDIEMRWHEETSFQIREISFFFFFRGLLMRVNEQRPGNERLSRRFRFNGH